MEHCLNIVSISKQLLSY